MIESRPVILSVKMVVCFFSVISILLFITGTRAGKETEISENTDIDSAEDSDALTTLLKAVDAQLEDRWNNIDEAYDFPLLNHRKYVEKLALTIVRHEEVLLVGGPRDSGKTTGLIYVTDAAQMVGYSVIDINLKGKVWAAFVEELMKIVSWKVYNALAQIEDYQCVLNNLMDCPAISQQYWQLLLDQTVLMIKQSISVVTSVSLVLAAWSYRYLARRHIYMLILLLSAVTVIIALIIHSIPIYRVMYSVTMVRERIERTDWVNMFCCLRTITHCSHKGPILIIRDVTNFHPDTLQYLLTSLHSLKEQTSVDEAKLITFPVILETSDNLWMRGSHMDSNTASFERFSLQEMSYEDGKQQLVNKYHIFNASLYDTMYSSFRGHTRFYAYTWKKMLFNRDYANALLKLTAESNYLIDMCVRGSGNRTSVVGFLRELEKRQFTWQTYTESSDIESIESYLIKCNLLYFDSDNRSMRVQNKLLETGITTLLKTI